MQVAMVTPLAQVAHSEVDEVVAPSVQGQVTILADHRPLLTDLEAGPVILRRDGDSELFAISGGFLEVDRDQVTILAETAERADEIDVSRAEAALAEAQKLLKDLDPTDPEYEEQWSRARRASIRLSVAAN